jgi:6-phosphogluconolactonase (cycloisomerase 2 family)
MRSLAAALGALAFVLGGCSRSGVGAAVARNAPVVLIVPYFAVVGDIRGSNSVSVYKINAATGALTLAAGSPFAAGRDPSAETLAEGRFAYVVNKGSNSVSAYEVNATTGALTPVVGSPFTVDYSAFGPNSITVDPAGKYAYVVSNAGVSAFSIDAASGALAHLRGSPFARGPSDGFGTTSIALDPGDRFAYVLNSFSNTVASYAIDPGGALKLTDRPLEAGQNSNNPGALSSASVDPKGKFLYVTNACCVYVYAIDATTGRLAPPAHVRLGLFNELSLSGFALDPNGKFAYAFDDGRLYAYTIDAATGVLKAVPGRKLALRAGTFADGVSIDPTGKFAYVFYPGDRAAAPTISAYRIDPTTGELTPVAGSPFSVQANNIDPVARWFSAGRCAAFDRLWADAAPLVKRDSGGVLFDRVTARTRGYFYDPASRFALHYPNTDSEGTFTLRVSGPPPPGVPRHELRDLHTASGIKLGTSSATVVGLLGAPKIVHGCGLQRYVYLRRREGEPTSLQFTIDKGRVTEIFEDFGG